MKHGDYVLGTKFPDGDPCDAWAVGFYGGKSGSCFLVVDDEGRPMLRKAGFRRVEKIPYHVGAYIVDHQSAIEDSGVPLWDLVQELLESPPK